MFEVTNQPPPLDPYNLFASDTVLREAVKREGAGWAEKGLASLGGTLGQSETVALGFAANRNPPELKTFDRFGHRVDEVAFHPAWHALLSIALEAGLHSSPWAKPQKGAHVARAAGTYMLTQIESGVYCPVAMTYGSVTTMQKAPEVAAKWLPVIFKPHYDPRFVPIGEKTGAMIGMGMTEKQGGSDLRTNTTRAEPGGDGTFRLYGHKWFLSAPMCDAFHDFSAGAQGPYLLLHAALDAGRDTQRDAHPAAQGQARQQVERLERGRVRRRLRAFGRRGRARHPDHHRDGQLSPGSTAPSAPPG